MADPISTAAGAGIASGKLLNMAAGFFGSLIALGLSEQRLPMKTLAALILFGTMGAYFMPPLAVSAMQHYGIAPWLQSEGVIAWAIGLGCIYITRLAKVIGQRFEKDPVGFVMNRGQITKPEDHHDH